MADITLTIPNDQIGRAVNALCTAGGYTGDPKDTTARRDFARQVLARYVRQTVMQIEQQQAMSAAIAGVTVAPITID